MRRRATLDQKRVDEIAAGILDNGLHKRLSSCGQTQRISCWRLEAAKALGEKTIAGFLVEARKH
jgi:hypothetical protein